MGLIEEVEAQRERGKPGLPCAVIRIRQVLEGEDLEDFEKILADPDTYKHTFVTRALRARGIEVARGAIGRHRRGDCGCAGR